tara:strand:+ start:583 stop:708 length:126 start_codon:yes stop_codon:yes gene_type:complete
MACCVVGEVRCRLLDCARAKVVDVDEEDEEDDEEEAPAAAS